VFYFPSLFQFSVRAFDDEFSDYSSEDYESELNQNDLTITSPNIQLSPTDSNSSDNRNNNNNYEMKPKSLSGISEIISNPNADQINDAVISPFLDKPEPKKLEARIKFGINNHPYLHYWLIVLSITGAPIFVYFDSKDKKFKEFFKTGVSLTLLVIYHLLFTNSAFHVLNSLPTTKDLYDSVWLQIYPIVFNLSVIIVADVMWITGLGWGCWITDILHCFKEVPRRGKRLLIDVRYDYFGGEHKIIDEKNYYFSEETKHKSKLQLRAQFMWKLVNFFVRQILAFGCTFTYVFVNFYLLKPIQLNIRFVIELINTLLTCFAWLTIVWIYMSFCQVLCWRFQHLNDWIWHSRRAKSLPEMRQFRVLISTYQHYLNTVTIIDDFFKYWIVGIFGVLFFQVSLYFQYVLNAFESWSPSLQFIIIPLITMPFLLALLLLIQRAANVNEESVKLDRIIVEICLYSRGNISDILYKKVCLI
jgi:hypothetical protein